MPAELIQSQEDEQCQPQGRGQQDVGRACGEEYELPLLGGALGAGNRRLQEARARTLHRLGDLAGRRRADRGGVNVALA